jgi:hypothetical protein
MLLLLCCCCRLTKDIPLPNGGTALYDVTTEAIKGIQTMFREKAQLRALGLDNETHKYLIVLTDGNDEGCTQCLAAASPGGST